MKKTLLTIALVLGVVLCLTGCGSKPSTLTCSMKVSSVDVELISHFAGKKIDNMSMTYVMDLSKYSDTMINAFEKQDFCATVKRSMSQYDLVDCKQSIEEKKMVVTSGIDISKMSSKDLTGSPEATKTALEKQGYTCTITY